jgi:hypothetical protein
LSRPDPSELPKLLKLSAITWTIRSEQAWMHVSTLVIRAFLVQEGRPAPGDTKELLVRLLKRAPTELPWPELPEGTADLFDVHLKALMVLSKFGEPEAAAEIIKRHVENIERKLVGPNHMAQYYVHRLEWLLAAAAKFEEDEGKRGAYVAEAKGLMERATRSLQALQPEDWEGTVSDSTIT